jgi:hypothetical protein
MPGIEELLREELQRVTDAVQREHLRPLRAPAARQRWQLRLIPLAAAAAVITIITVVALISGRPTTPSAVAPAAIPRFYLTGVVANGSPGTPLQTEVVIRDSASGRVTGRAKVLSDTMPAILNVAAYPDDRAFLIGTTEWGANGRPEYRFFRLRVSASGKPGPLTELRSPALPEGYGVQGFAVSLDGKLLAISLLYNSSSGTQWRGEIRVIDLATGKTRTWTAPVHDGHYFIPGPPSWADGGRMLAFTWQVSKNLTTTNTVMQGVRLLDTSAPGGNLMESRQIVSSRAVPGAIQSALITPDGRNVIVAASREVPSGGGRGTVVGQISQVDTATGKQVRVLRTQTARYTDLTHFVLDGSTEVFALDPAGRYALVQNMQFGWMDIGGPDPGRFTPLPGFPAGHEVFWAAW